MSILLRPALAALALFPSPLRERLNAALDTLSVPPSATASTLTSATNTSSPDGASSARSAPQQTTLSDMASAEGGTAPGGTGPDSATKTGADTDDCGDGRAATTDDAAAGPDTGAFRVPPERLPLCPACGGVLAQELITEHRPRDTSLVYDGFWCSRCDTGFQQCPTCDQLHRPTAACPVAALREE